jgi:hypothetical protein
MELRPSSQQKLKDVPALRAVFCATIALLGLPRARRA